MEITLNSIIFVSLLQNIVKWRALSHWWLLGVQKEKGDRIWEGYGMLTSKQKKQTSTYLQYKKMSVHLFGLQCQGADVLKFFSLFLLTKLKSSPNYYWLSFIWKSKCMGSRLIHDARAEQCDCVFKLAHWNASLL
jgi:hypothetical protein